MDSYKESIFEPLEYYRDHGKAAHNQNVSDYFDKLVEKSGVDIEANKATVKKYYETTAQIQKIKKKSSVLKALRVLSVVMLVIILLVTVILSQDFSSSALKILIPVCALGLGVFIAILLFRFFKKKLSLLTKQLEEKEAEAARLRAEAEAQMDPLNALFSDNDTFNLFEKTLPQVSFDREFLFENLEDLKNGYGFNGISGEKSSVLDLVSGRLYKNPFLFERSLNEGIGSHAYTGTLVIRWTEYTRDSKGRSVRRTRTQTLVASVTKPKPIYDVTTLLSYGSQAAPDLTFARENKHFEDLSEKQVEREIRKGTKKLKKKAEKALKSGKGFTEMANTKFDVLFDATNRDNEQQFRVMFTPLAQREMIDLIRSEEGYGDDFDFFKRKKLNVIRSEHSQKWDMSTSADRYRSFDFEKAKKSFIDFNNEYFKSVYFDFAPLIAIPVYQESPTSSFESISHPESRYTEYNYETIANKIGSDKFAHKKTATNVILKTEFIQRSNDVDTVAVTAYSYSAEPRTDFVPVLGGDGRMHSVPVPWIEYMPQQKTSLMTVKSIGLTESEYNARLSSLSNVSIPENAVCYKGIFAHIGMESSVTDNFLNTITK